MKNEKWTDRVNNKEVLERIFERRSMYKSIYKIEAEITIYKN